MESKHGKVKYTHWALPSVVSTLNWLKKGLVETMRHKLVTCKTFRVIPNKESQRENYFRKFLALFSEPQLLYTNIQIWNAKYFHGLNKPWQGLKLTSK